MKVLGSKFRLARHCRLLRLRREPLRLVVGAIAVAWNRTATASNFGPGMRVGWTRLNHEPDHYEEAMYKILEMWRTLPRFSLAGLHSIRAKTMIGARDHDLIRPEHTAALARAIPGAVMWIVPNASHSAMIERADLVIPRVLEFLKKCIHAGHPAWRRAAS
jgi:pimeloyl-ACP methyl ester carboxylesterase